MRDRYQTQKSQFETFKEKMREHAKKDCDKMIFTDDLKQFIHMCTKSEEELSLVEEMMKKCVVLTVARISLTGYENVIDYNFLLFNLSDFITKIYH